MLAERRLEAEEKKFAAGMSTSFEVFQAQRDLAQARSNELRAVLDYEKSQVDFETVQIAPDQRRRRLPGSAAGATLGGAVAAGAIAAPLSGTRRTVKTGGRGRGSLRPGLFNSQRPTPNFRLPH